MDSSTHLAFLRQLAMDAGHIMRKHRREGGVDFTLKPDSTRVTLADQEIGMHVARQFAAAYPGCVLIREETAFPLRLGRGIECVVDEIDGTHDYSLGGNSAVFAGAILENHLQQAAVVHVPFTEKPLTYTAVLGQGVRRNGVPVGVSPAENGKKRIAITTAGVESELYDAVPVTELLGRIYGYDILEVKSISRSCTLLAEGSIEGILFPWTTLHDIVPGEFLVREAGGITSDLYGRSFDFSANAVPGFLAANNQYTKHIMLHVVSRFMRKTS